MRGAPAAPSDTSSPTRPVAGAFASSRRMIISVWGVLPVPPTVTLPTQTVGTAAPGAVRQRAALRRSIILYMDIGRCPEAPDGLKP